MDGMNPSPRRRITDHEDCAADPERCLLAADAADVAVRKVFAILGVDVDDPEKVEEFRMDLRFGRTMRRAADKGLLAMIGVVAGGLIMAMWAGIKLKLGG